MSDLKVSVVIVSRGRPAELGKCLKALRFQSHRNFEVVVVADAAGLATISALTLYEMVKTSQFDEANISAARNEGIHLSAGEIVAFIDDDAIAEPTWLERLVKPFQNKSVAAAGGFVRGRNGISLQWGGEAIGRAGDAEPIEVTETSIQEGTPYRAIKTHGTNCAFRKSVLTDLGGFDETFRFYLDETDVNMRLAQIGAATAIVPGAEVQHGFAASGIRGADRAPKSLYQIGRSKGYFLKKYGNPREKFAAFRDAQKRRVIRHLVSGGLEPRDVGRLMSELENGFEDGCAQDVPKPVAFAENPPKFSKFQTFDRQDRILKGRWIRRHALFSKAAKLAEDGVTVTVFALSPTTVFHRRWFHEDGYWVQTGGKYGKSHRDDPLFRRYRLAARVNREMADLRKIRHTTLA